MINNLLRNIVISRVVFRAVAKQINAFIGISIALGLGWLVRIPSGPKEIVEEVEEA